MGDGRVLVAKPIELALDAESDSWTVDLYDVWLSRDGGVGYAGTSR